MKSFPSFQPFGRGFHLSFENWRKEFVLDANCYIAISNTTISGYFRKLVLLGAIQKHFIPTTPFSNRLPPKETNVFWSGLQITSAADPLLVASQAASWGCDWRRANQAAFLIFPWRFQSPQNRIFPCFSTNQLLFSQWQQYSFISGHRGVEFSFFTLDEGLINT